MAMHVESLGPTALAVRVEDKLQEEEYAKFLPLANRRIEEHGKIDLLVQIRNFRGADPTALWEDLKFGVNHYDDVARLAIVGASWSREWMARVSRPFTAADVAFFSASEIDAARRWIQRE